MDLNKSKSEKIWQGFDIVWGSHEDLAEPGQWPTDALYGRRGDGRHPETPCSDCKVWKFSRGVVDEPLNQHQSTTYDGLMGYMMVYDDVKQDDVTDVPQIGTSTVKRGSRYLLKLMTMH